MSRIRTNTWFLSRSTPIEYGIPPAPAAAPSPKKTHVMVLARVMMLAHVMVLARVMVLAHVMVLACVMVLAHVMVLARVRVLARCMVLVRTGGTEYVHSFVTFLFGQLP